MPRSRGRGDRRLASPPGDARPSGSRRRRSPTACAACCCDRRRSTRCSTVAGDLGVRLVVDPRHLLVALGDDAHLGRRRPRRRRRPATARCRPRGRRCASVAARVVLAGDGDERRPGRRARRCCARRWRRRRSDASRDRTATTGTGASGEMRVTRPTMKLVEHGVADDERRARRRSRRRSARARLRRRAAAASIAAAIRSRRGERQRDEHEEQHQELGVAEVVLEQPGGRASPPIAASAGGGEHAVALPAEQPEQRRAPARRRTRARSPAPAGRARRRSAAARCAGAG